MAILEKIDAWGHESILCTHNTTIAITKDVNLTSRGNCILGVRASKACYDLTPDLKSQIQSEKKFRIILKVDNIQDSFSGFGNKKLILLDRNDMVFRKSDFICKRTVLIKCSKSSNELNRNLINLLKHPEKKLLLYFEVDD